MHDDFGTTLIAIVKVLVGAGCFVQRNFMRNNHGRGGFAMMDLIHETAVIGLHIALTGRHALALKTKVSRNRRLPVQSWPICPARADLRGCKRR